METSEGDMMALLQGSTKLRQARLPSLTWQPGFNEVPEGKGVAKNGFCSSPSWLRWPHITSSSRDDKLTETIPAGERHSPLALPLGFASLAPSLQS